MRPIGEATPEIDLIIPERTCCPWCGHPRFYRRSGRPDYVCANPHCHRAFSRFTGTILDHKKKSLQWYEQVLSLYKEGKNAHHISKIMGDSDSKSTQVFLKRYEAAFVPPEELAKRKRYRIESPGPRPCNLNRMRKAKENEQRTSATDSDAERSHNHV